jgi:hypothetical protein
VQHHLTVGLELGEGQGGCEVSERPDGVVRFGDDRQVDRRIRGEARINRISLWIILPVLSSISRLERRPDALQQTRRKRRIVQSRPRIAFHPDPPLFDSQPDQLPRHSLGFAVYVRDGPSGDDDDRRGVLLSDPGCTGGSELKAFAEGAVSEYRDTEDDDRMSNRGFLTRCRYRMVCQSGNGGFETGDGRTDQEVSELFAASQWGWDFAGGSRGQGRRVTTRWAEHGGDHSLELGIVIDSKM